MMKVGITLTSVVLLAAKEAWGCFLKDTDLPGGDVDRLLGKVYSAVDCQRSCQGLPECDQWTYVPLTNDCYMKRNAGEPIPAQGLISGPRVCPGPVDCSQEGIDLHGGDLIVTEVANPLACQFQCNAVGGCAFWTFLPSKSKCFLKSTRVQPMSHGEAISGPRLCPSSKEPLSCEPSTDFLGYDLRAFYGVADAQRCQHICRGFNNCHFWTYIAKTESCYLKGEGAEEGREFNADAISGTRFCDLSVHPTDPIPTTTTTTPPPTCLLYNIDYQGADLHSIGLGFVTRPESCQLFCQHTPSCKYFTFFDGTCYMKDGTAPNFITEKGGAVSGPKECKPHHTTTTTTTPPTATPTHTHPHPPTAPEEARMKFLRAPFDKGPF